MHLTPEQLVAITDLATFGMKIGEITVHPYSGCATLSATDMRTITLAIVNPDGTVAYRATHTEATR